MNNCPECGSTDLATDAGPLTVCRSCDWTSWPDSFTDAEVCTDCYTAHHYGSDDPELLSQLPGELADNTCSNHDVDDEHPTCKHCGNWGPDNGIDNFSWSRCDGCHSTLGGARYRLAYWPEVR